MATEAARLMGGDEAYWGMLDDLFSNVKAYKTNRNDTLSAAVARLGLDNETFWETIKAPAARERISRGIAEAKKLGVKGTPRLFLDGRRLLPWNDKAVWLDPSPDRDSHSPRS